MSDFESMTFLKEHFEAWCPREPSFQGLLSRRYVMRLARPPGTHLQGFIVWTSLLLQVHVGTVCCSPKCYYEYYESRTVRVRVRI